MSSSLKNNVPILGWDIGGTKCAVVIGTSDGSIIAREEWVTATTPGFDQMIERFIVTARQLLGNCARVYSSRVCGLGVSVGGPMNMRTGEVLSPPHLPNWGDVPLRDVLMEICIGQLGNVISFSEGSFPVVVQHDAAACLQAEFLWGAAKGTSHSVYLTCATGCGSGVMLNGRVLSGPDGESPEVGYSLLSDSSDLPDMLFSGIPRKGQVELFCSGTGIAILANHRFPQIFSADVTVKEIAEKAREGNEAARSLLEESACRLSQLCITLSCIFSPEVILLGSLARYLDPWWLEMVRDHFSKNALPSNSRNTRICASALSERLQDLSTIAPVVMR